MASYGTDTGNTQPQPQMPQMPPELVQLPQPEAVPQPQMPPQMGVPNVAPPRRRSPLLIIGIIVVALLLVCGGGGFLLFTVVINATQPVVDAGEVYLTALRDGDYNKAFNLSSQSLQQQVGNAQGLQTALSSKPVASWSITSRSINNGQGALSGTTTYKNGETGTVDMVLNKVGNNWKVSGVSLK